MTRANDVLRIIRKVYGSNGPLALHAPVFTGNERAYVQSTIESTFVSSVGAYVDQFEHMLADLTGAKHVIATTNGTTALHMALLLSDVLPGDLVVTQSLSFVATANAIAHAFAVPAFVDVDIATLGMSPDALRLFLERECERTDGGARHRASGRRVSACVPMHSFGFPCRIDEITEICARWGLALVEDAAEALGSWHGTRHCGTTGRLGTLSFNGNKICTTGGGGAIMTNDPALAKRAKHLTTTAKIPHRWRFEHDAIGYNFRLPNLNAALGCAQLEQLDDFVAFKRALAQRYRTAFDAADIPFVHEPENTCSNYWLCAILLRDEVERDLCLEITNDAGIMTRPLWEPLHTLPMFAHSPCGPLAVTEHVAARLINIPSGVCARVPA
ncbi:perosamine synthetase [Caballeronia calidae]|uniref:Perosamine synthetase n=1 Tax=Caballeronia calidae TaxID=1777139 RepID=A0A158EGV8_9BURK|nr:LegC family aminotransferase [Caballeronia calidae]SAL06119.1 perosamine synthetase [Caballeronia calidae]